MPIKPVVAKPVGRLTLQQLVRATPSAIISRAGTQCHVIRKQYAVGTNDGFRRTYTKSRTFYNEARIWSACTDGKRNSYIRFYGPPAPTTEVWVWCSCPFFKYNLEVVLARYNSSSIQSSNGMLPIVRNRRMIPYLCKHLIIAAKYGLQQSKDLVQEQMDLKEKEKELAAKKAAVARQELAAEYPNIPRGRFTTPMGSGSGLVDL